MSTENVLEAPARFGTRHVQTLLMGMSLVVAYGMRNSISVAIVAMTDVKSGDSKFKVYPWKNSETSLILSAFIWGYTISMIPSGYLIARFSARKIFALGLGLSGCINLLTPLLAEHGGWIAVCASRVVMGLLQASFLSSMQALISKWAPPQERSRIGSFIHSSIPLGIVVGMGLSGLIAASNLGWPGVFYIFGFITIIMSLIFFFRVTDSPSLHPTISLEEKTYIVQSLCHAERDAKNKPQPPWKSFLTSVPMWALIFAHVGSNWGTWTLSSEIPSYMKHALKFDIAQSGLMSSLPYITSWLLNLPFSWLADYGLRRGMSQFAIRRFWNTVGMWLPSLAFVGLCFLDKYGSVWPVVMLVLIVGLNAGVLSGFQINYIDLSPNFAGTMFAVSNFVASSISIGAPVLAGAIVRDEGDRDQWHIVFYIAASVYFFTNLIFIIFGSGEVQPWNNPKKDEDVPIQSIYNPTNLNTEP